MILLYFAEKQHFLGVYAQKQYNTQWTWLPFFKIRRDSSSSLRKWVIYQFHLTWENNWDNLWKQLIGLWILGNVGRQATDYNPGSSSYLIFTCSDSSPELTHWSKRWVQCSLFINVFLFYLFFVHSTVIDTTLLTLSVLQVLSSSSVFIKSNLPEKNMT